MKRPFIGARTKLHLKKFSNNFNYETEYVTMGKQFEYTYNVGV